MNATDFDLRPVLGDWVNYDEQTTGILGVRVAQRRGVLTVQISSARAGDPDDWGITVGAAFGLRARPSEAAGFSAHYRLASSTVLLAAYLNKRLLVVDAYSVYTNGDGRANFFQRDHFYLP
ncbi:hypothetical protein [Actinocrispum sp. NPDC049592]|uniref:hypothetical protein n=1 Tax=Actinocrispum sp. NPDC049592 TaxID=3154835 RepID=UPI003416E2D4